MLFHCNSDRSQCPVAKASSQIQREAFAVIFGLQKFHYFLYRRNLILVTDHKPLVAMFNPANGTSTIAANRLERWALTFIQQEHTMEYKSTKDHENADALSHLPVEGDNNFDTDEEWADASNICNVRQPRRQLKHYKSKLIVREIAKDQVFSKVQHYIEEK